MEQKKHQKQSQEQLPFSGQLRQSIMNQPCNPADLWGRAADSFPQNKRNYRRIGDALFVLTRALDSIIICNFT